jgi:hypothetical protein
VGHCRHLATVHDRNDHLILNHHVVHCNEQRCALDWVELLFGSAKDLVVLVVTPAHDIAARPLVVFRSNLPRDELSHQRLGIGLSHGIGEHFQVCVEFRDCIGICDVGGEVHRRRHRLQLHLDPRLLAGLLDNRLGFLARRVDRGLEYELQSLAVLRPDAVGTALPTGPLQHSVRLFNIELPFRVLRDKPPGGIDEISRGGRGAAINVRLHRGPIDEQSKRLADSGIAEQRMMRLRAGALAIDLRPGIGAVELNVFDPAAPQDVDAALGTAAVFQFEEDLVLDLHVPGIVVVAGLDHRAPPTPRRPRP